MDTRSLIDGIVRQTTVLIAQLPTATVLGAPLARVAGRVFLDPENGISESTGDRPFGRGTRRALLATGAGTRHGFVAADLGRMSYAKYQAVAPW